MSTRFDVIVIGSGFGGSVMACRLAEKGYRVLVLERGRRWTPQTFPRAPTDPWLWNPRKSHRKSGWFELRFFRKMVVVQGAGVGGGSLVYANISIDAPAEAFASGWPQEITLGELQPYYDRVAKMLRVNPVPEHQRHPRFQLVKDAAAKMGDDARFVELDLAVTFDPQWSYDLEDPFEIHHSKQFTNEHGRQQGTCIHCGNCCIGCHVMAKNTLDVNYLARAESLGTEVRPLHEVRFIEPIPADGGYRVHFDDLGGRQRRPDSESAAQVVLAAGSLNSTELLLRCRDQYKTMRKLSRRLGYGWSSNGDFLTPALYKDRRLSPTHGTTISCAIDYLDGEHGAQFFIEDGGYPDLIRTYLDKRLSTPIAQPKRALATRSAIMVEALARLVRSRNPQSFVMPWFAQGMDAADGRLYLGRSGIAPWRRRLKMRWKSGPSADCINGIVAMHKKLSAATNGKPLAPPSWTFFKSLITPHPLGGCNMAGDRKEGVVDHRGRVFGYPGLYVVDGAIIPRAIGRNPSKTIAALAERIASLFGDPPQD